MFDQGARAVSDETRHMLRHAVATLAYCGAKVVANVPNGFSEFRINATSRSPGEILTHIGDLLDWALRMAKGQPIYHESEVVSWPDGVARFFTSLGNLDACLAWDAPLGCSSELIFQGPIADALTHVGQIAMLRRMAGSPVRGESYFRAEIVVGRVGSEQSAPRLEFD